MRCDGLWGLGSHSAAHRKARLSGWRFPFLSTQPLCNKPNAYFLSFRSLSSPCSPAGGAVLATRRYPFFPCAEDVLATRMSNDLPAPLLPCWSRTHRAVLSTCPSLHPPGCSPVRPRLSLVACSLACPPVRPPVRPAARLPSRPSILPTGSLPARSSARPHPPQHLCPAL